VGLAASYASIVSMAQTKSRRSKVKVWYRGNPYWLDLERCWHALKQCRRRGEFGTLKSFARAIGISPLTVERFFAGRPTSLTVTLKILVALHLTIPDVTKPWTGEDEGTAGASVTAKRPPSGSSGGAVLVVESTTWTTVRLRHGVDRTVLTSASCSSSDSTVW